jgi:nicotinate-nucleotide--dimethylbenzimidazole phosphoribosyltransferase
VSLLSETIAAVVPPSPEAARAARDRHASLTKPRGSLGQLEDLGARLAGMYAVCPPPLPEPAAVAVFAGDHGVHAQGVSPWPQEVTAQMVANFLSGGAAINVLARQCRASVCVVDVGVLDVGVAGPAGAASGLVDRKVRAGTADMTTGPAMTVVEAQRAVEAGIDVAADLVAQGNRLLVTGDMGIANTTPAAALIALFCDRDVAEVTGRGTGIDDATLDRKVSVVGRALALHEPSVDRPLEALATVGGLEHAAIAGFLIGAAAQRTPVLVDGVISCSAALVARALCPEAVGYWIGGHRSSEPGAGIALAALGLDPLVDLGLRLGEGSGAVLAVPLVQSAVRILREMATFDSAGVADKS